MYHVIIIEDDPMVASINKQYIEVSTNFRVEHLFKNGAEALPYIKTNPVDLVILDYYTPVMNGGEFLERAPCGRTHPVCDHGHLRE